MTHSTTPARDHLPEKNRREIAERERDEALALVAKWRKASGLESAHPDGVQPEHLEIELRRRDAVEHKLRVALSPDSLGDAMQTVWDDRIADSDTIPDCIKLVGKNAMASAHFAPSSFAITVSEHLLAGIPRVIADPKRSVSSGVVAELLLERNRQKEIEKRSDEHDDKYCCGELPAAAACYAIAASVAERTEPTDGSKAFGGDVSEPAASLWPWHNGKWKPTTRRRDLIKAGALIVAEIERGDRASAKATNTAPIASCR